MPQTSSPTQTGDGRWVRSFPPISPHSSWEFLWAPWLGMRWDGTRYLGSAESWLCFLPLSQLFCSLLLGVAVMRVEVNNLGCGTTPLIRINSAEACVQNCRSSNVS